MTRDQMIEELHAGICTVVFDKVDGTERTMKCTLMEGAVPPRTTDKSDTEYSMNVVRAWDIENKGWRSFRVDRVKSFT